MGHLDGTRRTLQLLILVREAYQELLVLWAARRTPFRILIMVPFEVQMNTARPATLPQPLARENRRGHLYHSPTEGLQVRHI